MFLSGALKNVDPFTGGSSYSTSEGGPGPSDAGGFSSGVADPFTGMYHEG